MDGATDRRPVLPDENQCKTQSIALFCINNNLCNKCVWISARTIINTIFHFITSCSFHSKRVESATFLHIESVSCETDSNSRKVYQPDKMLCVFTSSDVFEYHAAQCIIHFFPYSRIHSMNCWKEMNEFAYSIETRNPIAMQ